ncbi:MAG: CdaR family protein [Spirochaetes bacterium]|nr:CdaR family protein [Spirochaetota bacterium]
MKIREIGEAIINNWPAKILSIAAAVLLFYFYKLNTTEVHFMTVPLEVTLNRNFVAASIYPTEVRVSLRGSSETLSLIHERDIAAYVDFSARNIRGEFREPVRIRRSGNALYTDPLEIRVRPSDIRLNIEEKFVKNVPILPIVRGLPAENYEIISSTISSNNITVSGPLSVVERIASVRTEDINIENRRESFTTSVKLERVSEFITFLEGDEVQFFGRIERIFASPEAE